jgi:hypothetical protein
LRPEDIIGLKLQAGVNDPQRALAEYSDIESLMSYHKKNLNWGTIEEYFLIFEQREKFLELKGKYYNAK